MQRKKKIETGIVRIICDPIQFFRRPFHIKVFFLGDGYRSIDILLKRIPRIARSSNCFIMQPNQCVIDG